MIDNTGDTILPFIRVYLKSNYPGSVYDLAYSRFLKQPFQSLDEHIFENGALEYLGAYSNENDGKDYEFRMLYFKEGNNMAEIRLETTVDTFDNFDKTFIDIINSVKAIKK